MLPMMKLLSYDIEMHDGPLEDTRIEQEWW